MDKSLDEIIKERKLAAKKMQHLGNTHKKKTSRITDARLIIIERKRSKIRDARDVLNELRRQKMVDAREKIEANKCVSKGHTNDSSSYHGPLRSSPNINCETSRIPKEYVANANMKGLKENDYAGSSGNNRRINTRDRNASEGIIAKPLDSRIVSFFTTGFRVFTTNLHPMVDQNDIQQLFGRIGPLHESRIISPGIAEVTYKSLSDAEKAIEEYNNRLLDDLPMKCVLVNPG